MDSTANKKDGIPECEDWHGTVLRLAPLTTLEVPVRSADYFFVMGRDEDSIGPPLPSIALSSVELRAMFCVVAKPVGKGVNRKAAS